MAKNKIETIKKYANEENIRSGLSDDVIIEIVHILQYWIQVKNQFIGNGLNH